MGYGEILGTGSTEVGLFAVPAFFITFRETIEAAIVVAVLIGLLDKLRLPQFRIFIWVGIASAFGIVACLAIIVMILVDYAKNFLQDDTELAVEGSISIVAALLIGFVAVSIGNIMSKTDKYEERMTSGISNKGESLVSSHTIFWLAFTAVLREGVETILFFTAIGAAYPTESLPIPAITGAITGLIIGWLMYKFGGKLTMKWFFRITMVVLVFIGAGVFVNGLHALQIIGTFGTWEPDNERPPMNVYLWDISGCCGYQSQFWVMMRVLFGYTPYPTGLEVLFYLLYHFVAWTIVFLQHKNEKRRELGKPTYKELVKVKLGFGKKNNARLIAASSSDSDTASSPEYVAMYESGKKAEV